MQGISMRRFFASILVAVFITLMGAVQSVAYATTAPQAPTLTVTTDPDSPESKVNATATGPAGCSLETQWSPSSDFTGAVPVTGDSITGLSPLSTIYIRSRCNIDGIYSDYAAASITTSPAPLDKVGIIQDAATPGAALDFLWNLPNSSYKLQIQIATDQEFTSLVSDTTNNPAGYGGNAIVKGLPFDKKLWIRTRTVVNVNSKTLQSRWSSPQEVTTPAGPVTPLAPDLPSIRISSVSQSGRSLEITSSVPEGATYVAFWVNDKWIGMTSAYMGSRASMTYYAPSSTPLPLSIYTRACYSNCFTYIMSAFVYGPVSPTVSWTDTPGTPSDFKLTQIDNTSLKASWAQTSDPNSYTLQWDTSASFPKPHEVPLTGNLREYTLNGLTEGSTIFARIHAKNYIEYSSWAQGSAQLVTPAGPDTVSAEPSESNPFTSVTLDWPAVDGALKYEAQILNGDKLIKTATIPSSQLSTSFTGLDMGTAYTIRVRGILSIGSTLWSSASTSTELSTPQPPSGVSAISKGSGTQLTLSWNPSATASSYYVYANDAFMGTATTTSFELKDLNPEEIYSVRVSALNIKGEGTRSNAFSAATTMLPTDPTVPAAPVPTATAVTSIASDGTWRTSITLTWPQVVGAQGYDVYLDGVKHPCTPAGVGNAGLNSCSLDTTLLGGTHDVKVAVQYQKAYSPVSAPVVVTPPTPSGASVIIDPPLTRNGPKPQTQVAGCAVACAGQAPASDQHFSFQWVPIPYADSYDIYLDGTKLTTVSASVISYSVAVTAGTHPHLSVEANLKVMPGHLMAILGDSYTSGEGTFSYDMQSDGVPDQGGYCHRSRLSWGWLAAQSGLTHRGQTIETTPIFLACSGARTKNLLAWSTEGNSGDNVDNPTDGVFQNGHSPQIPVLRSLVAAGNDVEVVSFTIGGNDAGFSSIIKECMTSLGKDCDPENVIVDGTKGERSGRMLQNLPMSLANVYKQIKDAAPEADLYTGSYPVALSTEILSPQHEVCERLANLSQLWPGLPFPNQIVDPTGVQRAAILASTFMGIGISETERQRLNDFVATLNETIKQSAARAGVGYVEHSFNGNDYCSTYAGKLEANYLDGLTVLAPQMQSFWDSVWELNPEWLAVESMHPSPAGYANWAPSWEDAINNTVPPAADPDAPLPDVQDSDDINTFPSCENGNAGPGCSPNSPSWDTFIVGQQEATFVPSRLFEGFAPSESITVKLENSNGETISTLSSGLASISGTYSSGDLLLPELGAGLYSIKVEGVDAGGADGRTKIYERSLIFRPAKPSGVKVEPTAQHTLDVSWSGSAANWVILYSLHSDLSDPKVTESTENQVTLEDVDPGKVYYISVLGVDSGTVSNNSLITSARVQGYVPTPPQNLQVSIPDDGKSTASISFQPPANSTAPVTGYTITAEPGGATVNTQNLHASMDGLNPGTPYRFSVVAHSIDGDSVATTSDPIMAPSWKPASFTVMPNVSRPRTTMDISWESNKSYHIDFALEKSQTENFENPEEVPMTISTPSAGVYNTTVSGLEPDHTYWWRLKATVENGDSQWSDFVTGATEPLTAPTGLVASNDENSAYIKVDVSWDDQDGALWQVQYDTDPSFANPQTLENANSISKASLENLDSENIYYVRVRAVQPGRFESEWSETSILTLRSAAGLFAARDPWNPMTSFSVYWYGYVGEDETWEMEYSDNSDFTNPHELTFNNSYITDHIEDLQPDSDYWVRIHAVNENGPVSLWSKTLYHTTSTPAADLYLSMDYCTFSDTAMNLNWAGRIDGNWEVEYGPAESFTSAPMSTSIPGDSGWAGLKLASPVVPGSVWHARVRGIYADGTVSGWATTEMTVPSDQPIYVSSKVSAIDPAHSLDVSWNHPLASVASTVRYAPYDGDPANSSAILTAPGANSITLSGLDPDSTYQITVQWGEGPVQGAYGQTAREIPKPSNIRIGGSRTTADGATRIAWDSPPGSWRFEAQYSLTSDFASSHSLTAWSSFEGFVSSDISEVPLGSQFWVRVRTLDDSGSSDWVNAGPFTQKLPDFPKILATLNYADPTTGLDIAWNTSLDGVSAKIEYSTSENFENPSSLQISPGIKTATLSPLAPGTKYYIRARWEVGQGVSAWYNVTATTNPLFGPTLQNPLVLASVTINGQGVSTQGEGNLSSDGRFLVFSSASSIEPANSSGYSQAYMKNLITGKVTRVSHDLASLPRGAALNPYVSSDGRYVVFQAADPSLPGGSSASWQIYLYDTQTSQIRLVSATAQGAAGAGSSQNAQVSSDGKLVVFLSASANFSGGSTYTQVYLKNMDTGTLTLISKSASGAPGNQSSSLPLLSANGAVAVFGTMATNIDTRQQVGYASTYAYTVSTGGIKPVATTSSGAWVYNAGPYSSAISADGRYVLFHDCGPYVSGGSYLEFLAFRKDLTTGAVVIASLSNSGAKPSSGWVQGASSIDASGRYVTFQTGSSNMTSDAASTMQLYLRDIQSGTTTMVSKDGSTPSNGILDMRHPGIAVHDGHVYVAFRSTADNLLGVPQTSNSALKIFLKEVY